MAVTRDFAFIIYAATFTCWAVAEYTAWLNDDRPPAIRWWILMMLGLVGWMGMGIVNL